MEKQNLTFQHKKELVKKLHTELNLSVIASELKISKSLLTLILNGDRKDKCGAIDYCYSKIESTIKSINK